MNSNVCSRLIFVSKCPSVLFSGNCTTYILMCKSIKFFSFSLSALERGTSVGPASVRTLTLHPFAEHLQEISPDLVSTSNRYRKPSHKIDLCPLFVSITVTSILTYSKRMSSTFLCSWTEFSHGKETFLPLAKWLFTVKTREHIVWTCILFLIS